MADRPATPTLSPILLSDPQTCQPRNFSPMQKITPLFQNFQNSSTHTRTHFSPQFLFASIRDLHETKPSFCPSKNLSSIKSVQYPRSSPLRYIRRNPRKRRGRVLVAGNTGSTWDAQEAPLVQRQWRRAKENRGGRGVVGRV